MEPSSTTESLLYAFRDLVFDGVKRALEESGHGKSYEGSVSYQVLLPAYGRDDEQEHHVLELRCYVLGPSRAYRWEATDAVALFTMATLDVRRFIAELDDD